MQNVKPLFDLSYIECHKTVAERVKRIDLLMKDPMVALHWKIYENSQTLIPFTMRSYWGHWCHQYEKTNSDWRFHTIYHNYSDYSDDLTEVISIDIMTKASDTNERGIALSFEGTHYVIVECDYSPKYHNHNSKTTQYSVPIQTSLLASNYIPQIKTIDDYFRIIATYCDNVFAIFKSEYYKKYPDNNTSTNDYSGATKVL
jgi:hypothetical protein